MFMPNYLLKLTAGQFAGLRFCSQMTEVPMAEILRKGLEAYLSGMIRKSGERTYPVNAPPLRPLVESRERPRYLREITSGMVFGPPVLLPDGMTVTCGEEYRYDASGQIRAIFDGIVASGCISIGRSQ